MKASLGLLLFILPIFAAAEVVVPIDSVENSVNIRMSADAATEIVGKLRQGESLPLVGSVPGWHEVEIAGGATGFISADWSNVLKAPVPVADDETLEVSAGDSTQGSVTAALVTDAIDRSAAESSDETTTVAADAAEVGQVAAAEVESAIEAETATADEGVSDDSPVDTTVAVTEPDIEQEPESDTEANDAMSRDVTEEATIVEAPVDATNESVAETTDVTSSSETVPLPVVPGSTVIAGLPGPPGVQGPAGPAGPPGPSGNSTIKGSVDYLMKFTAPTVGGRSLIFDNGNSIGIGTTEPKQRLEVNGNIQIHEQNSGVAGLMITQSSGETGYIMHNRASTLTIGAGSVDRITIDRNGNVGFGMSRPSHPIEMASGAHVSAGGVWTNSSSRTKKENIAALTPEEALRTLALLQPVRFNYKNDQQETYVGFIAEDVPELVATSDRQGLSAMDIVAVLTKVVQEQQQKIEQLEARLDAGN